MMFGFHSNNMWRKLLKVCKIIHEKRMHTEIEHKNIQLAWRIFAAISNVRPGCTHGYIEKKTPRYELSWVHGEMAHPGAHVILHFHEQDSVWIMPNLRFIIYAVCVCVCACKSQHVKLGETKAACWFFFIFFSSGFSKWPCHKGRRENKAKPSWDISRLA